MFLNEKKLALKMKAPIKTTLFSFSFIQKHFLHTLSLSSSSSATPNSSSFTVQFLVNSCGLSLKSALSASIKLRLHQNNVHKTEAVLLFLKSHHFDDTQIANLIKKYPQFLRCKVESNLKPKFEFLLENGFPGNLLPHLILRNPHISHKSLDSQIKPSFEFLKSYAGSNQRIYMALKRDPWLLIVNWKGTVQPNIDLLIKEGVPLDRLAKLIISQPRALINKNERVVYAVNSIKNLGLQPDKTMFIHALVVRMQMSDTTWKKKIEVMKSLGWSEEEIFLGFKRFPHLLAISEKKIRSSMDFFINNVELEKYILLAFPLLLAFSVDKRIRPRFNVISLLKSKDLIKGGDNKKIHILLKISEEKFLENYVVKYKDDVPGLLELYMGTADTKKKQDS